MFREQKIELPLFGRKDTRRLDLRDIRKSYDWIINKSVDKSINTSLVASAYGRMCLAYGLAQSSIMRILLSRENLPLIRNSSLMGIIGGKRGNNPSLSLDLIGADLSKKIISKFPGISRPIAYYIEEDKKWKKAAGNLIDVLHRPETRVSLDPLDETSHIRKIKDSSDEDPHRVQSTGMMVTDRFGAVKAGDDRSDERPTMV